MTTIIKFAKLLLVLIVLIIVVWVLTDNYSVIFSKSVVGEITAVERIELPMTFVSHPGADINGKLFAFAVGIKDRHTGEIATASSEDRQWAVAQKGQCAEAQFLPYPPWDFKRKGTYFGARLLKLYECPK